MALNLYYMALNFQFKFIFKTLIRLMFSYTVTLANFWRMRDPLQIRRSRIVLYAYQ